MVTDVIKISNCPIFLLNKLITVRLLKLVPNKICHNCIGKLDPIHITKWCHFKIWLNARGNSLFWNMLSGIKNSIFQATECTNIIVLLNIFYFRVISMEINQIRFFALPMGTWNIISLGLSSPVIYRWNSLW